MSGAELDTVQEETSPEALVALLRKVGAEARYFHQRHMVVQLDATHADLLFKAADTIAGLLDPTERVRVIEPDERTIRVERIEDDER